MKKINKFFLLSLIGIIINIWTGCQKEGRAYMLNMYFSLQNYANDHQGNLPQSNGGPYQALQKLYPEYCSNGKEFAGLSGNPDSVSNALKNGEILNSKLTPWVYIQGLKITDDPAIAVLWDSQKGLFASGRTDKSGGRAVLFLNGEIRQIPESEWESFLEQQKSMLNKRVTH